MGRTWEYLQRFRTCKTLERKLKFSWKILFAAPENKRIHKILEASEIALKRPSLNEQIESKKLLLFRNGVTWEFYNF